VARRRLDCPRVCCVGLTLCFPAPLAQFAAHKVNILTLLFFFERASPADS
jgi:hypothetical protein